MLIVLAVDGYATLLERVIGNKIGGISVKRLTYDFCIAGNHCWQVKGADNLECSEVCKSREDEGCNGCPIANAFDRLAAIEDILGDDYDLDRLKELVERGKKENDPSEAYNKLPEKGQEVWYWDSNRVCKGIVDFVNVDFYDNSLNEFGVDFPDENDFDIFAGSAWGTCIVASKETALEKMKEGK